MTSTTAERQRRANERVKRYEGEAEGVMRVHVLARGCIPGRERHNLVTVFRDHMQVAGKPE